MINKNHLNLIALTCLMLTYLFLNVMSVGRGGASLELIAAYVALFAYILLIKLKGISIKMWMFLLFIFIGWISLKVTLDLNDISYLKQITISTTGGILLFLLLGSSLSLLFQTLLVSSSEKQKVHVLYFIMIFTLGFSSVVLHSFIPRMRDDLFYITGVDGQYQRPGDFISIIYLIVSYTLVHLVLINKRKRNINRNKLPLSLYGSTTLILLIISQLIGSNSSTAVIMILGGITSIYTLIISRKRTHRISLLSKRLITLGVFYSLLGALTTIAICLVFIYITGFDINKLNVFGFGSGQINSLVSRYQLLTENLLSQLAYSPFLGDMNVSMKTTGSEGHYVHSFLLYTFTHLGLIGLLICSILFIAIFTSLMKTSGEGIAKEVDSLFSIIALAGLFAFANIAATVSWAVLWFATGLLGRPLRAIKSQDKLTKKSQYSHSQQNEYLT